MVYDITLKYSPEYLRDRSLQELEKLLSSAQQRFFELRCQSSPHGRVKYVRNPDLFGKVKKDIARIKTIMSSPAQHRKPVLGGAGKVR